MKDSPMRSSDKISSDDAAAHPTEPFQSSETDNNLSGGQLRKREGGFVAPAGGPNETSAAIAILRRGDCDSNGPATLQTLNPRTAQNLCIAVNANHDSSTLDYWKEKEGQCLACGIDIAIEDQYCPTHAQELGEMIDDSLVRSSDSHRAFQH